MKDHKPSCWKFIGSAGRRADTKEELSRINQEINTLGMLNSALLAIGHESRIRQEPNENILEVLTCGH